MPPPAKPPNVFPESITGEKEASLSVQGFSKLTMTIAPGSDEAVA